MNSHTKVFSKALSNDTKTTTSAQTSTVTPLKDIKIRLSTAQATHLWDKGYRFDDLAAILKIGNEELPAKVLFPTRIQAVAPKDSRTTAKPPKFVKMLKTSKVMPSLPRGHEWLPFSIGPDRDCQCINSGEYCAEDFPDSDEAYCDHFWHDLTFIRQLVPLTSANYGYDSTDCSWIGVVTCKGSNYQAVGQAYRDAVLAAAWKAFEANRRPVKTCMPNMMNSDDGLASQDATGPDQIQAVHDANVALTAARGESQAVTAEIPDTDVKTEYYSEQPATFPHLTDRDLALPPVQWTSAQTAGQIIASFDLPYDILANNLNSPNYIPFQTYAQCEPQLTVRAQLQSVPANGGHLVVGVRYAALDEVAGESTWALKHVAQLVQTNHVILSAQSSNSSEIQIPFQYFIDRIPTTWNSQANMLYYCTMYVGVLNPLVVGPEAEDFVNLNLYCSFQCNGKPTRFFGQRNFFDPFAAAPAVRQSTSKALRQVVPATPNGGILSTASDIAQTVAPIIDIVEPGLGTAIGGVAGIVGDIGGLLPFAARSGPESPGRPLLTTDHPQVVLVQNHGLALASAPLDAKSMRLQKTYATPQPTGRLEKTNHLTNKYITSVHGLYSMGQISIDNNPGDILLSFDVTPATGFTAADVFYPAPIGAMSYMYSQYSGDIKFTMIVGSSLMHSCRIRMQYIPDYSPDLVDSLPALENRNSYLSTVFDLQEQTQFTFSIPYQTLTPMAPIWEQVFVDNPSYKPRRFTYGRLRVILETPLKANNSVSPTVNFSTFVSGGDNFQLAVPHSCLFPPIPNADLRKDLPELNVTPNMEERFNDATLVPAQPPGKSGIPRHIGERHDISDLIHRYTLIAEDYLTLNESDVLSQVVAQWPVNSSVPNSRVGGIIRCGKDSGEIDPLTHIQDAFRFNKGSTRYLVTIASPQTFQFDLYHLPYISDYGPNGPFNPLDIVQLPFGTGYDNGMGSGAAAEYWDTRYNSAISLEIPFYQHTSCLLSDAISTKALDETWSSFQNGRMRLVSRPFVPTAGTEIILSLYRAAGNDLHLTAFQGFPPRAYITDGVPVQAAGRVPTTPTKKQDFNLSYAQLTKIARRSHKLALRKVTPNMMRTIRNTLDMPNAIHDLAQSATNAVASINHLTDNADNSLTALVNTIRNALGPFVTNFNLVSFAAHLIVIRDTSASTFSRIASFFGILGLVGLLTLDTIPRLIEQAYGWMTSLIGPPLEPANVDPQVRHVVPNANPPASTEDQELTELLTMTITSVNGIIGVSDNEGFFQKAKAAISAAGHSRSVEYFCSLIIKYIRKAINWVKGEQDPQILHAENLAAQSDALKLWSTEVDLLTSLHNQDKIYSSLALQKRTAEAKQQGATFFNQLDSFPPGLRQSLTFYYRRICELYDQVGMRLGSGEKPQEPISIWMYGTPGCGKSYAMDAIAVEVLRSLKVVYTGDPIFTRDMNKYWNGYVGQPCIKYDDVGVNRSPTWMEAFVGEFFALHTPATFNPDQADLRDKNRIVNSRLIMVGSNNTTHKTYVGNDEAFRRRRDLVIACKRNDDFFNTHAPGAVNCNDNRLTGELLANYSHLLFRLQDPLDIEQHLDAADGWMTYPELLTTIKPLVEKINARRSFAANNRNNLANSLSPEYWATLGDAPVAPPVTTLNDHLDRLIQPAVPNYFPIAWDTITGFFSRDPRRRWETELLVADTAAPTGTYEAVNTELVFPEFETLIDFTRVNCHHRLLTTDFAIEGNFYVYGNISIPVGPCIHGCDLTQAGIDHLLACYERARFYIIGFRMGDFAAEAQPYGPARDRQGNMLPVFDEGAVRFERPLFNFHNIIDHLLTRAANFRFRVGTWLADHPHISFVVDFLSTFLWIYCSMIGGYYIGQALLGPYGRNPWTGEPNVRVTPPTELLVDNAHPNLQQSGDVKTSKAKKAARKSAARTTHRATPNAPQSAVPQIEKNFVKLSFASRTAPVTKTISAFMIQDRTAICPVHFWEDLRMESNWEWEEIEITPKEYSDLSQRQINTITLNEAVAGPVKFTCPGKPPLYVDYASAVLNPLDSKYDLMLSGHPTTDDDRLITFTYGTSVVKTRFSKISFLEINTDEEVDLACFKFSDNCIPQFRDLSTLIASDDDLAKVNLRELELVLANEKRSVCLNQCQEVEFIAAYGALPSKVCIGFQYDNPTGYYPCSSILLDARHSKIIGFHTCSSKTIGYSLTITKELLPPLTCSLPEMPPVDPDKQPLLDLSGEFFSVGAVPNHVHQTTTSSLKRSLIHDDFPTYRRPCKLFEKGEKFPGYTPLKTGCEKQTVCPPISETPEETELISNWLHSIILTNSTPTHETKPHLSLAEAIEGIPGVPFIDPLILTTSAGWPYNMTSRSLKKHYISRNEEGKVDMVDPTFMKNYNAYHAAHLAGKRPAAVFTDFLKDERLKEGKDTRLINGSSFEYTLEVRRYFLGFLSAFKSRRFKNMVGIGMNVHGPDVTEMVNLLRAKGEAFICGDYSNFGPTLDPTALNEMAKLINAWYDRYAPGNTETDNKIRENLLKDAANSMHLAYDHLYILSCGSPSGSPITDVTNSYVDLRYVGRAWLKITSPYPHLNSLSAFTALCGIVVYGDDLIISTTPAVAKIFNNSSMSDYFATIGIRYTDASKTGTEPSCGLDKASFLKCNFHPHPTRKGQWLAALDWRCVHETPAWIRKSNDDVAATVENCHAALLNAHGHGPDLYKQLEGEVTESLRKLGIPFSAPTWAELDRNFFESDEYGYTAINYI